ncbi:MAG: HipA domain-containing protein [Pyrinomonadaceae bacterium]|nr:HipA domain-containing protein [Pyrinomonadaceae bacterium]
MTISGDAPKDFIIDREYRPGHRSARSPKDKFIAKVGSKYYPLESIIEQFITRIGQIFDLNIADSKLRTIDGQVRFLSKYFLKAGEQLTHGAEIYEYSIGRENYAELSEKKLEADYFTFQMTCEAINVLIPDDDKKIVGGYVEMLTFDAVIGHNDRHPYNWGMIVPLQKKKPPRFAPVFDTARALFWNIPEKRVVTMLTNKASFEAYIHGCQPPIGWDDRENVDFFELIGLIWIEFPVYRKHIEKFLETDKLERINEVLDSEFGELLSAERRELIKRCLHQRQSKLKETIKAFEKEQEEL